jgi:hypothetical protein
MLKLLPERLKHLDRTPDLGGREDQASGSESGALPFKHRLYQGPSVSSEANQLGAAVLRVLGELDQAPSPEAINQSLDVLSGDCSCAGHVGHGLRSDAVQVNQHAALARHGRSVAVELGGERTQPPERCDDLLDQFLDLCFMHYDK